MGIWKPETIGKQATLILQRGSTPTYSYTLQGTEKTTFPNGKTGELEFRNSFDQVVGTVPVTVASGVVTFDWADASAVDPDSVDRGTTWTLIVDDLNDKPRELLWGMVVRSEARYPDFPDNSEIFDAVQYSYSFGTPGYVVDPAWRILNGQPFVWDNSFRSLPNSVASGGVLYDDVAMEYFAPLNTDAVRLTYNTIRAFDNADGECWVALCANYDMTNWAGVRHRQVWGIGSWDSDTIEIVTGSGPVNYATRASASYDTANNQNYTVEYNPASNTYAVYLGTSLSPLVSWTDSGNLVNHGPGERYVGMGFKSDFLSAGVQISDWWIGDVP